MNKGRNGLERGKQLDNFNSMIETVMEESNITMTRTLISQVRQNHSAGMAMN